MKKIFSTIILLSALFASGCGETGQSNVTLYNNTNFSIKVYYDYSDSGDGTDLERRTVTIKKGESESVDIYGDYFTDADIVAVFGGIVKNFSISFNIFNDGSKTFTTSDFYN